MECKSWLYWPLILLMMTHILVVGQTQGYSCIKEERKAQIEIKASLVKLYDSKIDHFLPTWVDYGNSTPVRGGGDCCDWERVNCNTTTQHVTQLSLYNLREIDPNIYFGIKLWPLNVSLFFHFKELTSLNLSHNALDKRFMKTGLESLSSLNKLEVLDLSWNDDIDNDILPSIKTLTSLKILDLSYTGLNGNFPIREFAALENLETLDLTYCGFNGTFEIQGSERVSILRNLRTLNLGSNRFNESIITSLKTVSSLTSLDLSFNPMSGPFPAQELSHLTNLKELDLRFTQFNETPNIQACKSLSRLKRLESINLYDNKYNKSIISCLSALPSLKILDLSQSFPWEISFPVQEFLNFSNLEVLLLKNNGFRGTIPMEVFSSFHRLEVLDLSGNRFHGSLPSAIQSLSSLRALSFAYNDLNGSLPDHGLCELKNLHELDLRSNMLHGNLPQCLKNLSSLKFFDISSNRFRGTLVPSLVANLTSLEYVDFSNNMFEGSFSFSSFSNHTNLKVVRFASDNDRFEVETEEPTGWIPKFQLQVLELSNCNIKIPKGHVIPGFLIHQHKLRFVDMSSSSLEGHFPNWLIKNNTNMKFLILSDNLLKGMPLYSNVNLKEVDMSGNHMVGNIPDNIPNFFPNMGILNLSMNALTGAIPSSIGELSELAILDLSGNVLSGEVPKGLFTNISRLFFLKLSNNKLQGQVLSGNLSWGGRLNYVYLDSNNFTGKISSNGKLDNLRVLDISNNFFTGVIPGWLSNMSDLSELVVRNNTFEGGFPCGEAPLTFLDISQNSFSGPIPSCSNIFQNTRHLLLGSNKFNGPIPKLYRNLTQVLTLDMGNNNLSGTIPKFLGELSSLRILLLRKNNFSGSIPKQLCQLSNVSFIDLSGNSLSGSIPSCLENITGPTERAFFRGFKSQYSLDNSFDYEGILEWSGSIYHGSEVLATQDEVQYTTKRLFLSYTGDILNFMAGLDFSYNKLTGEIPEQLGLLTQLRALNLSHNHLIGHIPVSFSHLAKIESLDLSSNGLTGEVPSELIKLNALSTFIVSQNNLSGRLPAFTAQFGTFTDASYEGNLLLCGPPLKKKCTTDAQVTNASIEEVEEDSEKWYDIDMACFYRSSSSTCVMFLLGFLALLYTNPQWRRRWLDWVEDCMSMCYYCMSMCYYIIYDFVRKPSMIP